MNIQIRNATGNDATAIALIGRQSFTDAFGPFFIEQCDCSDYVNKTYTTDRVRQSISNPQNLYFLGCVDGEPVGFVKLKIGSRHPVIVSERQMELQRIYVLKEYHGSGVGQRLMDEAIAATCGGEMLWLDVYVCNEKALRFYRRNGFVRLGEHRFTIGSQEFLYDVVGLDLT
jgi:ribosomal protein S18 acetylase RimI-like enzyme